MAQLDITRTNDAVERLLRTTENPRHRFMLTAYHRHRYLEIGGRYEEIFSPDMMVEKPVYRFNALGTTTRLEGQDQVKGLYSMWAKTHQSIFYAENEQLAVCDTFIASVAMASQQILGRTLIANGNDVDDPDAYYVYKSVEEMVWSYDDRGRLVGEDVWEPDPDRAEVTKMDPADVTTTEEAGKLLAPFIKPLPSFDEMVLRKSPARRR